MPSKAKSVSFAKNFKPCIGLTGRPAAAVFTHVDTLVFTYAGTLVVTNTNALVLGNAGGLVLTHRFCAVLGNRSRFVFLDGFRPIVYYCNDFVVTDRSGAVVVDVAGFVIFNQRGQVFLCLEIDYLGTCGIVEHQFGRFQLYKRLKRSSENTVRRFQTTFGFC